MGRPALALVALLALSQAAVYDIHLEVGSRVSREVVALNARAQRQCPSNEIQFSWAAPHVTLYQTDFLDGSERAVIAAVKDLVPRMRACEMVLQEPVIWGRYLAVGVAATICLQDLADSVVEAAAPWHNRSQPLPDWVRGHPDRKQLEEMFQRWGSPTVFGTYAPHITVAWDEVDNMTALLDDPYVRAKDLAVAIGIGPVSIHGTVPVGKDIASYKLVRKDDSLEDVVFSVGLTAGILSAIGSMIVILSFALFKDLRSKPRLLITLLSLSDLGQALFFCFPLDISGSGVACDVQSLVGIFFANATFLWTASISLYVLVSVKNVHAFYRNAKRSWLCDADTLIPFFCILSFGIPLLIIILVASFHAAGPGSGLHWCFIPSTKASWRVWCFYVPLFSSLGITTLSNITTIIDLQIIKRQFGSRKGVKGMAEWQLKLLLIPLFFVCLRTPDVIYRAAELQGGSFYDQLQGSSLFIGMVTAGDALQGLVNFFIFVVAVKSVRNRFLHVITRCELPQPREQLTSSQQPSMLDHDTEGMRASLLNRSANVSCNSTV
eukprot:m51a1_g4694 hypothetical protein (550) ;mRNA; r:202571-205575